MSFDPLQELDARLEAAGRRGAEVVKLGLSAGGHDLVAVRMSAPEPALRVLVLAGMHAPELLGPLAALALIEAALAGDLPASELTFVPCIDRDGVAANLAERFDLPLGLPHLTDYEALLPTRSEPVGAALWPWLLAHEPVDALFSLHAAAHVAPGGFFYAAVRSPSVQDRWVRAMHAAAGSDFPWAQTDPTGSSDEVLAHGFFRFPRAGATTMTGRLAEVLRPRLLAVSELPPAVAPSLAGATLDEIHRASMHPPPDTRVLPLELQLRLMVAMVSEGLRALR